MTSPKQFVMLSPADLQKLVEDSMRKVTAEQDDTGPVGAVGVDGAARYFSISRRKFYDLLDEHQDLDQASFYIGTRIYFLGLTLYCTRNQKGNFKVGMRTEKSRLRRSLLSLQELMRQIRHYRISDQVSEINAALRGHYGYYGIAGNFRALFRVYRAVERYWHRMLRTRSWAGARLTWDAFHQIKKRTPSLRPKLRLPYRELPALAVL